MKNCQACEREAVAFIIYGSYQAVEKGYADAYHSLPLCMDHGRELWGRCAPAVSANMMFFDIYDITQGQSEL